MRMALSAVAAFMLPSLKGLPCRWNIGSAMLQKIRPMPCPAENTMANQEK